MQILNFYDFSKKYLELSEKNQIIEEYYLNLIKEQSNAINILEQEVSNNRQMTVTVVERFTTPESKKVNKIFMTEFLPTLTPGREKMTVTQYIDNLKKLNDQQLKPIIEFFNKKGYIQPNEDIKKFQGDILKVTGIDKYANTEQINKEFTDGVFGVATAKATIGNFIENLNKTAAKDPNKLVGDIFSQANKDLANTSANQKVVSAPTKQAGKSVNIDIGTQKIK